MKEDKLHAFECDNGIVEEHRLFEEKESLKTKDRNDCISLCHYIDIEMVPAKLTYLCWGGLIGTYIMYLNPFLVSLGLPKGKTGAITGIGYVLSSLSGPLWGLVTDHTGRPKAVLFLICVSAAMWVLSLPFIASFVSNHNAIQSNQASKFNMTLKRMNSSNETVGKSSLMANYVQSLNGVFEELNSTQKDSINDASSDTLFCTLLIIMPLGAIFYNNIHTYIEATALKFIKVSSKGATYGAQRLFGAIGGTASIFMTGFLVERFQFEGLSNFSVAFFVFVPFPLILIPLCWLLVSGYERNIKLQQMETATTANNKDEEEALQKKDKSVAVLQHLRETCSQVEVAILMTTALVAGVSFHLFIYFTMFLINDKMDVSLSEVGFVFSGVNVANILMFPLTGKIIKLLRGPKIAIIIGLLAHCARNIFMSYTNSYWVMLAVQAFHCFDFALLVSAMMDYVHEVSHREIVTTMIMILQSIHFGFSPFLINVAGGVLYQMFGGDCLFFGIGVVCGLWGILLMVYYGTDSCRKKTEERKKHVALLRDEGP